MPIRIATCDSVQPGDFVLHLTDNEAFTGVSIADSFAHTDFIGLEGTNWDGLPCYRISLRDFRPLKPPLTRERLFDDPSRKQRLIDIRRAHQNLFYDPDLDFHQGGYLTAVPKDLIDVLDELYFDDAHNRLFGKEVDAEVSDTPLASDASPIPQRIGYMHQGRKLRIGMSLGKLASQQSDGITSAISVASTAPKRSRRKWTNCRKSRSLLLMPINALTSHDG